MDFERPKELEQKRSIHEIERLLVESNKIASILSAAQFKSKSDKRYQAWSDFWDGLPEPEGGPVPDELPPIKRKVKK